MISGLYGQFLGTSLSANHLKLSATKSRMLPQIHFGKDNIGDSISVFSSRKIGTFVANKLKVSL